MCVCVFFLVVFVSLFGVCVYVFVCCFLTDVIKYMYFEILSYTFT